MLEQDRDVLERRFPKDDVHPTDAMDDRVTSRRGSLGPMSMAKGHSPGIEKVAGRLFEGEERSST
jgi:hypothetical protein